MILSHRHAFIFLHVPKTAGSSTTVGLARHMGPLDVQVGVWADRAKAGIRPNLRFFVDMADPGAVARLIQRMTLGSLDWSVLNSIHKGIYNRSIGFRTAVNVRNAYPKAWATYFKFAFVRNPYARFVSQYYWQRLDAKHITFSDFLAAVEERDFTRFPAMLDPWDVIAIDDTIVMDHVGRFESLLQDFELICTRIGIPVDMDSFPRMKAGKQARDYRAHYTSLDRRRVERIAARELEAFGYDF